MIGAKGFMALPSEPKRISRFWKTYRMRQVQLKFVSALVLKVLVIWGNCRNYEHTVFFGGSPIPFIFTWSDDSSYWGVHHARYLYDQCEHMFKNTANTTKKQILNAYYSNYPHISKGKNPNVLTRGSGSEKNQVYLQIVNHLHEKCTWPFKNKKLHRKQKMQYVSRTMETISKNAPNLHRHQKTQVFELQSPPN